MENPYSISVDFKDEYKWYRYGNHILYQLAMVLEKHFIPYIPLC